MATGASEEPAGDGSRGWRAVFISIAARASAAVEMSERIID